MALTSNEVKAAQLGMPYGTAIQRLRKKIIFQLVQETGRDSCFKCNLKIISIDELSIEHKQPWLYISTELFWDLDNIAFSHVACNRPDRPNHGRGIPRNKITPPEGTAWCNRHKEFLPKHQFSSNKSHWTGVHTLCKVCQHYNRNK